MSGTSHLQHDQYLSSLAALPPQKLFTVNSNGEVVVLAIVTLGTLLPRLAPSHVDLRGDVDKVVPEIVHWGRLVAIQKRVWTIREREYRTWKARQELAFRSQMEAEKTKAGWGQGGRVSMEQVEAAYRTAKDYAAVCGDVEEAEEAYLFADVVYRAYRSKQEVLMADVRRVSDGTMQRLSP